MVAWKIIRKVVIKGIRWCRRFNGRKVCGARRFDFLLNLKTISICPVSDNLKETPMHPSWKKKDLLQGYSYQEVLNICWKKDMHKDFGMEDGCHSHFKA